MYRTNNSDQLAFENFYLPFGGHLRGDNRWVILSKQIPWSHIEQVYGKLFPSEEGCPAKSARMAFGALFIKERLGTTDRETVEQIKENPYLQYFIGMMEYNDEQAPFDPSLMTHFRKRFSQAILSEINAWILHGPPQEDAVDNDNDDDQTHRPNQGKLIVDATCTPADIAYPTDLSLLNEARQKSEQIIDAMHEPFIGLRRKPRTYRQAARKAYLAVAKQKKPGARKIRKAVGKQLRYLQRNLGHIDRLVESGLLIHLSKRLYRMLLVIRELYRQQLWMYENNTHSISDRIVSLSQPHVRPIVRGKAKASVEFGAKVSISLVDGFSYVDKISWDAYNESGDLKEQIKRYKRRFGCYPESVHADTIYRTADNRRFCRKHGIRLSGPQLGRPSGEAEIVKEQKKLQHRDECDRIAVEGKFGQGKRRFSLSRIMAKLDTTSEVTIMMAFIVMNLEKILSGIVSFTLFLCRLLLRGASKAPVWADDLAHTPIGKQAKAA
jgi:transposase, IS5 family